MNDDLSNDSISTRDLDAVFSLGVLDDPGLEGVRHVFAAVHDEFATGAAPAPRRDLAVLLGDATSESLIETTPEAVVVVPGTRRRTKRARGFSLRTRLATIAAALAAVGGLTTGLAAAQVLPAPIQHAVDDAFDQIGIHLPGSSGPKSSGSPALPSAPETPGPSAGTGAGASSTDPTTAPANGPATAPNGSSTNGPTNGATLPVPPVPPVGLPGVTLPGVTVPGVTLPPVNLGPVTLPPPSLPPPSLPPVSLPTLGLPVVTLPPASLPPASLPPASLPPVSLPPVSLPPVSLPPVSLPPLTSLLP